MTQDKHKLQRQAGNKTRILPRCEQFHETETPKITLKMPKGISISKARIQYMQHQQFLYIIEVNNHKNNKFIQVYNKMFQNTSEFRQ